MTLSDQLMFKIHAEMKSISKEKSEIKCNVERAEMCVTSHHQLLVYFFVVSLVCIRMSMHSQKF